MNNMMPLAAPQKTTSSAFRSCRVLSTIFAVIGIVLIVLVSVGYFIATIATCQGDANCMHNLVLTNVLLWGLTVGGIYLVFGGLSAVCYLVSFLFKNETVFVDEQQQSFVNQGQQYICTFPNHLHNHGQIHGQHQQLQLQAFPLSGNGSMQVV